MAELRVFATIAETGHFTRAADQLGMSQSALSAAIVKLEKLLGTRLFDRHTRSCHPTDAGVALLPAARRLLADWDQLLASGRDFATNARGRVDVAAPNAQCALLLPPVIKAFREAHPNVRLVLHDVPEHEVYALVRNGTADLGIATQTDARPDLLLTPLATDQFVIAMSPEHRLASRRSLEWSHLAGEPIIGYLPGNPVRRLLDDKLAERGIKLDYVHEIALPWTTIGLAREGLGLAVVTMALRPLAEWHGLVVRPVSRPQLARTLSLLRAPGNALSPAAAAFRDLLTGLAQARPAAPH